MKAVKALLLVPFVFYQLAMGVQRHVASDGTGTAEEGTTWATAINIDTLEKVLETTVVAGDVFFVKGGTYTIISEINASATPGTKTNPISLIGVKPTTSHEGDQITYTDWAVDSVDMPLFQLASVKLVTGNYYRLYNLHCQGDIAYTVTAASYSIVYNCYFNQTHNSAQRRYVLSISNSTCVLGCVFRSALNNGIFSGNYNLIKDCLFRQNKTGIFASAGSVLISNVFTSCSTGISLEGYDYGRLLNNTFYGCTVAISGTDGDGWLINDNIIANSAAAGVSWITQTNSNMYVNNHLHGNAVNFIGVDTVGIYSDHLVTTGDPLFRNPPDSLQLQTTSPCINTGSGPR